MKTTTLTTKKDVLNHDAAPNSNANNVFQQVFDIIMI